MLVGLQIFAMMMTAIVFIMGAGVIVVMALSAMDALFQGPLHLKTSVGFEIFATMFVVLAVVALVFGITGAIASSFGLTIR